MLQSRSSEKKLVKPLKNCFWQTQFPQKGHYGPHPNEKQFFGRNNKRWLSAFRNFLFYQNILFWLSFDWSFSILSDVFLSNKCHFQLKQLMMMANTSVSYFKNLYIYQIWYVSYSGSFAVCWNFMILEDLRLYLTELFGNLFYGSIQIYCLKSSIQC